MVQKKKKEEYGQKGDIIKLNNFSLKQVTQTVAQNCQLKCLIFFFFMKILFHI